MSAGSRRGPRRASRPAPEGSDPRPADYPLDARAAEDRPEGWGDGAAAGGKDGQQAGENDVRLRQDVPPHWG